MKKLSVMMLALCAAFAAKAAMVDWSVTKNTAKQQNGSTTWAGTYYLVNTSVSTWESIYNDIKAGTVNAANIASSAAFVDSAVAATGKSAGAVAARTSPDVSSLIAGDTAKVAYLLFQTVDSKDYYYLSGAIDAIAYESSDPDVGQKADFAAIEYAAGSGWTAISSGDTPTPAVPEPTSGVLMLVGMGVLALRRKRA